MNNIEELLLTVRKPGRYSGGEWNSVRKEWTPERVKFLVAFPDAYEVGMSYLGLKIIYGILNEREDCLCERVFSPWLDFEKVLKDNNIPLFSLESRRPIKEFDIIGICLTYELGYTNVLAMLDLGGIPLRAADRTDGDPIVIAGGPACYNPEPMAEFVDAFVIGDGEEVIGEIVDLYKALRCQDIKASKKEFLKRLTEMNGVYVPSLYEVEYNDDRTIKYFRPLAPEAPKVVAKRVVKDLDSAYYPINQIVPFIQIVHDRVVLEIMRGCKHACKFCQATATYRPCRERSREKILELAQRSYEATGYDEISLLSLSSGDHSGIKDLICELNKMFEGRAVSISVPSLRVEDVLKYLPSLIAHVKKSGLTFAPEAGSDCLRRSVNKNIDIEKLFGAITESVKAGWRRVKLYFMIGLPGEKDEDVIAIAELVNRISDLGRAVDGRPVSVAVSVNGFVPKPHTSFERLPMENISALNYKKELLRKNIRSKSVELSFHSSQTGFVEAVFARGDRNLARAVQEAWKAGARFDGWTECFNYDLWIKAFEKASLDPLFYVTRQRPAEELLPWSFIRL